MTNNRDLAQTMAKYFSLQDIKTLCFNLGVEFEDLPHTGGTRTGTITALIKLMQQQKRMAELLQECSRMRPRTDWSPYSQIDDNPMPRPMSQLTELEQIKRKNLQKRMEELTEEYQACFAQLGQALSEVEKVRLRRTLTRLEEEMQQVEDDLADLS